MAGKLSPHISSMSVHVYISLKDAKLILFDPQYVLQGLTHEDVTYKECVSGSVILC